MSTHTHKRNPNKRSGNYYTFVNTHTHIHIGKVTEYILTFCTAQNQRQHKLLIPLGSVWVVRSFVRLCGSVGLAVWQVSLATTCAACTIFCRISRRTHQQATQHFPSRPRRRFVNISFIKQPNTPHSRPATIYVRFLFRRFRFGFRYDTRAVPSIHTTRKGAPTAPAARNLHESPHTNTYEHARTRTQITSRHVPFRYTKSSVLFIHAYVCLYHILTHVESNANITAMRESLCESSVSWMFFPGVWINVNACATMRIESHESKSKLVSSTKSACCECLTVTVCRIGAPVNCSSFIMIWSICMYLRKWLCVFSSYESLDWWWASRLNSLSSGWYVFAWIPIDNFIIFEMVVDRISGFWNAVPTKILCRLCYL